MPTAHTAPLDTDWVFVAYYRCARCGRHVTMLQYDGDPPERRAYRNLRVCPDGCKPQT
jgi:DNA-directed RNA polymerase subunit RPC12/RpoP